MKILKNYTFTWWQMGVFKLCLLSIGIAIGAYWQEFFSSYVTILFVFGLILGLYIGFVGFKE